MGWWVVGFALTGVRSVVLCPNRGSRAAAMSVAMASMLDRAEADILPSRLEALEISSETLRQQVGVRGGCSVVVRWLLVGC